jgi:hypothetical protein
LGIFSVGFECFDNLDGGILLLNRILSSSKYLILELIRIMRVKPLTVVIIFEDVTSFLLDIFWLEVEELVEALAPNRRILILIFFVVEV